MAFSLDALRNRVGSKDVAATFSNSQLGASPLTIDPNVHAVQRALSRATGFKIPFIGHRPLNEQILSLGILAFVSILFLIIVVVIDVIYAGRVATNIEIAGDSLMHSQRLARSAPNAIQGNEVAIRQLLDSHDTLASNLERLAGSTAADNFKLYTKAIERWEVSEKASALILSDEKLLLSIGETLRKVNEKTPELLDLAEQAAALKLQSGASSREISASSQLVMLTQRMSKNANELLTGSVVNPEVAFLLGKDTNTFKEVLDGLINGSDSLRLGATRDTETRARLEDLRKSFGSLQQAIASILGSLQKVVAAKQADCAMPTWATSPAAS
jgi:twitching motility protein PilJ